MSTPSQYLLVFAFLGLLVVSVFPVSAVDDLFIINLTDTRTLQNIDYGAGLDVTLTSYKMHTSTNLATGQSWILYGFNDETGWKAIDQQTGIAFTAGVNQTFTITAPAVYRYYGIYLERGFYKPGETLTMTFTTTQGPYTPPTPIAPPPPPAVASEEHIFITTNDTREEHVVDYNTHLEVTLTSYKVKTSPDLTAVQSWVLYGFRDGVGWQPIDAQSDIAFVSGVEQTFTVPVPTTFRYYDFYTQGGFYKPGNTLELTLISSLNQTVASPEPWFSADFVGSPRIAAAPADISFTDVSDGYPTAWNWSFGDGNFSEEQNPTHEYITPGNYTVSLNASAPLMYPFVYNVSTKIDYIRILAVTPTPTPTPTPTTALASNFVGSPLRGNAPVNVSFTDVSDGYPTAWNWSFGDSGFSEEQNPTHEYITPGSYEVSLNASTSSEYNISTKTNYIIIWAATPTPTPTPTPSPTPIMITAQFVASPLSGSNPLFVSFTDLSTGPPTAWNWSFGDDTYDNTQYPTHTYSSIGSYTVELFVSNVDGNSTATKPNYIVVVAPTPTTAPTYALPFTAQFVGTPLTGSAPLDVSFTDLTAGGPPTAWDWSFGDGSANVTLQNPLHRYNSPGTYTVMLNASDSTEYSVMTKVGYVVVSSGTPTSTPTPLPLNATNVSPFALTAQRGETWIKWVWEVRPEYSGKYVTMQAVVDGKVIYQEPLWNISTSEIPETYVLDGINPQEEHQLTLDLIDGINGTVLVHDSLKLETITDSGFYMMLFGVAIALLLIAIYLGRGLIPFILSALSVLIALYLIVSLQEHNKEFAIVVTIFAVFAGYLIINSLYKMIVEGNNWSD